LRWKQPEVFFISKFPSQRHASKGPQVLTPDIRATEVRLIDGDRNEVISRREAEELARERGLDLVVVSFDSSPLVVRLVDYGKFKFEADKKAREAKKKQHVVEIKEVKMGVRIDDHDYKTKLNHAQKFLEQGNKVKCTIRLKGRETQHSNLAFDLARKFVVDLQDFGVLEGDIRMEGRTLTINISPAKKK
jgi:translation initiation factor IF-3